ncbi:MAG TPA: DUF3617 family protein [Caulobacteraceae bacterium]|nr:DUF3617 family protein [Caulobacteraceae bacterium]
MHKLLMASAAVLALAGCSKTQGGQVAGGSGSPVASDDTTKIEMPMRKAGLWEHAMLFDGKVTPGMDKIRLCVGPATNAEMSLFGEQMKATRTCQKSVTRALDGSYVVAGTCKTADGATTTSKGTVSGDYSTSVKMHSESDTTGAPQAGRNTHSVIDVTMTYLGACPADMVDGDEIANGMKVNLLKTLGGSPDSKSAKP